MTTDKWRWCTGALGVSCSIDQADADRRSYEVQIDASYRGAGLGYLLMRALENLGRAYKMRKVMLTVFTGELFPTGMWTVAD